MGKIDKDDPRQYRFYVENNCCVIANRPENMTKDIKYFIDIWGKFLCKEYSKNQNIEIFCD